MNPQTQRKPRSHLTSFAHLARLSEHLCHTGLGAHHCAYHLLQHIYHDSCRYTRAQRRNIFAVIKLALALLGVRGKVASCSDSERLSRLARTCTYSGCGYVWQLAGPSTTTVLLLPSPVNLTSHMRLVRSGLELCSDYVTVIHFHLQNFERILWCFAYSDGCRCSLSRGPGLPNLYGEAQGPLCHALRS